MKRLTDKDFRLGFDDSNKLPSYESIYERLREHENKDDKKVVDFGMNLKGGYFIEYEDRSCIIICREQVINKLNNHMN